LTVLKKRSLIAAFFLLSSVDTDTLPAGYAAFGLDLPIRWLISLYFALIAFLILPGCYGFL
jgi:hypothetical protein